MTLEEIKQTIEQGGRVHWHHSGYEVIKDKLGKFLIVCSMNDSAWGLTWTDGVTMNEKEEDFFLG
jgi:hypothetical protein